MNTDQIRDEDVLENNRFRSTARRFLLMAIEYLERCEAESDSPIFRKELRGIMSAVADSYDRLKPKDEKEQLSKMDYILVASVAVAASNKLLKEGQKNDNSNR